MDVKRKIAAVEALPVEEITVRKFGRKFQVYPWIKSRIFHKVIMGNEVLQEKTSSVLKDQLRSLFYGFFSFFRKYDAWAFTTSSERVLLDGKYMDKVMDPLTIAKPIRLLVVELQLFKKYKRSEVASKKVVSRAWIIFLEEIYMRLFLRKITVEGREVLSEIEEELGNKVEVNSIIRKYLAQYRVMKFLLWLLPKPKVVFLTVSYANFGYIKAWKEAGIRVVEMQHGLIGDGHYGYVYHKIIDAEQFPDEILVFGEQDQEFFATQTVIPIKRAIPVGRYILDHYKRNAAANSIPVKTILVSLQDSEWSTALLNFILEIDRVEPGKYNWVIQPRRTPEAVYREQYDFPSNFVFSHASVYEAIGKTDAHLTIFSTTAIESLSIGKPTFLYDFEGAATTYLGQFLASNPNAYFCATVEAFIQTCSTIKMVGQEEIAQSNSSNISSGYLTRISDYLDEVI